MRVCRHQQPSPLDKLLIRLGWRHDPRRWVVSCRDARGRHATVRVTAVENGVVLAWSSPGPWLLTGLAVGRLRGALAAASIHSARLADHTLLSRNEKS